MKNPATTNKFIQLKKKHLDIMFSGLLLIPALFLTILFIFVPLVDSVIRSFLDFTARNLITGKPGTWNNFSNYTKLFQDPKFGGAITATLSFVFFVVAIQLIVGMILALILNSNVKGARFLRSIIMTPWIVPTVISALVWMWIFQPQYGLMKYIVSLFTGGSLANFAILNNPGTALLGIGIAALWKQIPLTTLLMLAGLQNVPDDMLEAARIDGASKARTFFSIVLPFVKSVINITAALAIIANFKQFPLIWTMTGGGPSDSTTTFAILSYRQAFVSNDLGAGSATTTIWMLFMVIFIFLYNKIFGPSRIDD